MAYPRQSEGLSQRFSNPPDGGIQVFLNSVFPNSDYSPVHAAELSEIPLISLSIFLNLLSPKSGEFFLPLWKSVSMPKVTIYKDRKTCLLKDNIRITGQFLHVRLESQSSSL